MKLAMAVLAVTLSAAAANAAEPTAAELLAQYDAVMGPKDFKSVTLMTAHRDDGSTRAYKMRMLKSGDEKFRVSFDEPASARGQEILRVGENSWLYMPNLKRAVRMANRDSFQGGDFNNADVLRVNYTADYDARLDADPAAPDAYLLELKAKTSDASYDRVRLWLNKSDRMPRKAEFYTSSGKLLRTAEFFDVKDYGNGYKRPSRVLMKNMVATKRFSEMTFESVDVSVAAPANRFVLDDLGR